MIWLPPTFPISHLHAHSPARVQGLWPPALPHSSMTLYTLYLCSDPLRPFAYLSRFAHVSRLRSTVISSRVFFALPLTSPVCIRCCFLGNLKVLCTSHYPRIYHTCNFSLTCSSPLHLQWHCKFPRPGIIDIQYQQYLSQCLKHSRYSISVC